MIYLIGIILEFLAEIALELLFQLGFRRVVDIFKHPLIVAILFGIISGFVSLLFFSDVLITNEYLQIANLLITPVMLGFIMSLLGKMYKKFGLPRTAIDNFAYGFSFAMAMTLVRYIFGTFVF